MAVTRAEIQRMLDIQDYLEPPHDLDRFEIIAGDMIVTPPPVPQHGDVQMALYWQLNLIVLKNHLGKVYVAPIGVRFTDHDILQPDIFFIPVGRKAIVNQKYVDGVPDLVAEVLSPSTRRIDLIQKMAIYEQGGVKEYWVIDLATSDIRLFILHEGKLKEQSTNDGIVTSLVIPDLSIDISELFSNLW